MIQASLVPTLPRIGPLEGPWYHSECNSRSLDLSAQTLNLPFGQPPKEIIDMVINVLRNRNIFYSSRFGSNEFEDLAYKLIEVAPDNLSGINHKLCNGTDAVETALKIAFQNQRNKNVLALKDAWHGESFATLQLSNNLRSNLLSMASNVCFSRSNNIDSLIELARMTKRPSTVILDPVGFSRGLFCPKSLKDHLAQLREECLLNGHILIFDEIQCFGGFLGAGFFSYDVFNVESDIVTIGKALGQGFPVAACLYDEKLPELQYNEAEFTYGGQPPACVAALAGIKYTIKKSNQILESHNKWLSFVDDLRDIFAGKTVRNMGFFCVVDFTDAQEGEGVFRSLINMGIFTRLIMSGKAIAFKSPLIFDDEMRSVLSRRLKSLFPISYKPPMLNRIYEREIAAFQKRELDFHGLTYAARSRKDQEGLVSQLTELKIPSQIKNGVFYKSLEDYKACSLKEAKQIYVLLVDWIKKAHDNKVVIGNRNPANSFWDGKNVVFSNFGTVYLGDFNNTAAFEHLFTIYSHSIIIPGNVIKFISPFIYEYVDIWGLDKAVDLIGDFKQFYMKHEKGSVSELASFYIDVFCDIERLLHSIH